MKLKQRPEDFIVTEVADLPVGTGNHALYRLAKCDIGTLEALSAAARCWNLPRQRMVHAGLKDRHAATEQFVTVREGPRHDLTLENITLTYLGQTPRPICASDIQANRFEITVRDLTVGDAEAAQQQVSAIERFGVPNYFDNQRFGSLGESGEWVAAAQCRDDYERALWLALADPHTDDSSFEKRQKSILHDHWGDWIECKQLLDRSHRRSIVTFLADKMHVGRKPDFRAAFARINSDLRGLYLSAWQSALWNRVLTRLLRQCEPDSDLFRFHLESGEAVFPMTGHTAVEDIPEQREVVLPLMNLRIPLPSARISLPEGPVGEVMQQVLADEGFSLRDLKIRQPRDRFFSRGQRDAFLFPTFGAVLSLSDELNPGRRCVTFQFTLPRGSYATIVIRRLLAHSEFSAD
ncbi:MAG: tRNA pseudouridine(13) synthase TruD [Planctomycetaceae bacterium]|nr:tRNA pseudouridine(13) synthase TruD [Planctomycetaceae bacterium]